MKSDRQTKLLARREQVVKADADATALMVKTSDKYHQLLRDVKQLESKLDDPRCAADEAATIREVVKYSRGVLAEIDVTRENIRFARSEAARIDGQLAEKLHQEQRDQP